MSDSVPFRVCETFSAGVNPAHLAITPNGQFAYVANTNNFSIPKQSTVSVLNLQTGLPLVTIADPSFDEPYRVAIDKRGKRAYVCNSASTTVSIIDTDTNKVSGVIGGFNGPSSIVMAQSKPVAYVGNFGIGAAAQGHTISVVNLRSRDIVTAVSVARGPQSLALSSDDRWLYVVSYVDGQVGTGVLSVICTETHRVVDTLKGFFGPYWVAVNAKHVYVTNFGSNDFTPIGTTMSVVRLEPTLRIIKNIALGIQPAGMALSPDGEYAYASTYNALYAHADFKDLTYGEGTVHIVRLKDHQLIAPTIPVGQTPATLTMAPDGSKLYVCKFAQNTVAAVWLGNRDRTMERKKRGENKDE